MDTNIDTSITLREASYGDAELLFNLSNDVEVRKNSIQRDTINWDDHLKWLKDKIDEPNYLILLFFKNENFIGQLKFEISSNEAIISISICKNFRGKGLTKIIFKLGIEYVFRISSINTIIAYIREDNLISYKSFLSYGFIQTTSVLINEERFHKLLLKRSN